LHVPTGLTPAHTTYIHVHEHQAFCQEAPALVCGMLFTLSMPPEYAPLQLCIRRGQKLNGRSLRNLWICQLESDRVGM